MGDKTYQMVLAANPTWFCEGNRKFSGDIEYGTAWSGSHNIYLWRKTNAFSDMFTGVKKVHYRLNEIDQHSLKVLKLVGGEFKTFEDLKEYLEDL